MYSYHTSLCTVNVHVNAWYCSLQYLEAVSVQKLFHICHFIFNFFLVLSNFLKKIMSVFDIAHFNHFLIMRTCSY